MRGFLLSLAIVTVLISAAPQAGVTPAPVATPSIVALSASLEQGQPKDLNVDINVNHGGGVRWYANPMWIAIGAVAAVVVILLIVLIARGGGGTTIVRE